jgi:tetratricopeptide (TPR) repeat protein
MRRKLFTLTFIAMTATHATFAQLNLPKMNSIEHQLEDVMEIIDTTFLKTQLKAVELAFEQNPSEINKARKGIIYHETALNLGFLSKTGYKGYAQKSYDILTEMAQNKQTTPELLPFITSYRASAISLVGAETKKLGLLGDAFRLFEIAVKDYADVSYLPEFLRGSVAENLPWIFYKKRRFAKLDMQSIIDKQVKNKEYANDKIMSFVYWAWANQHQGKNDRTLAIKYLDNAIFLDPNYTGGRKRAEELKVKLNQ